MITLALNKSDEMTPPDGFTETKPALSIAASPSYLLLINPIMVMVG
jgi:hypothetical protein